MVDQYVLIDLRPTWHLLENNYSQSGATLVSPFKQYMELVMQIYTAMHNETSEDEVLVDNYINGSYAKITQLVSGDVINSITSCVDVIVTLADVSGSNYPGKIRSMALDYVTKLLLVRYGGDYDNA